MKTEVAIDDVFPSLEAHAARLNAASDRANQLLAALEERLLGLNIGLEYWHSHPIEVGDPEGDVGPSKTSSKIIQVFGLARVDGKWCLAVKPIRLVEGFFQGDMDCPYQNQFAAGPATTLLKASRALRIAALQAVPDFLAELNKHVSVTTREIESTSSAFVSE